MNWLDLLSCPDCRGPLTVEVYEPNDQLAQEGTLTCASCHHWFPISNGVPRLLLPGPLRGQDRPFLERWTKRLTGPAAQQLAGEQAKARSTTPQDQAQVQSIFAFKWKRQPNWGIEGKSAQLMEDWILRKYGWDTLPRYKSFMTAHPVILDAGCGLGREAIRMASQSPRSHVIGLELSECIDEARKHVVTKKLSNLLLIQADLQAPPLRRDAFHFILSEGVLHHTPSTERGFQQMAGLLAPGGEFAFYVYRKKAPLREYADDYVREQLQGVPLEDAWKEMEALTALSQTLSKSSRSIEITHPVKVLGFQAESVDLQRWIYNNIFKCYWNDALTFQENVLVNFDWYLPRYAWRHTIEEVRGWIQKADLTLELESVEDAGLTYRAVRSTRSSR